MKQIVYLGNLHNVKVSPTSSTSIWSSTKDPVFVCGIVYEAKDVAEFEADQVGNFAMTTNYSTTKPTFIKTSQFAAFHVSSIMEALHKEQVHVPTSSELLTKFHQTNNKGSKKNKYLQCYYAHSNSDNCCALVFKCNQCQQLSCDHLNSKDYDYSVVPSSENMHFRCEHTSQIPKCIKLISSYQGKLPMYTRARTAKHMSNTDQYYGNR